MAPLCGSKNLPFGNPAKSRLANGLDSRRLCGPRSRVVCLCRLSFKGGAGRTFRLSLTAAAFRRKRPRLLPSQTDGAEHTFQRNYKTDGRGLSITILHRLTNTISKVYVVFLDYFEAISRNGRTQQRPCLPTESVYESGRIPRLSIAADASRVEAFENSLRLTRVLLHAPNES